MKSFKQFIFESDKKDTISFDIPLLIRVLEYAREELKDDVNLHKMVERLIDIRSKGVLTMDDYNFIVKLKEDYMKEDGMGGGAIAAGPTNVVGNDVGSKEKGFLVLTHEIISDIIRNNFGLVPDVVIDNDVVLLRIKGIDNVSLAKYILDKTDKIKITVKEREGYKFSDIEWIKIEPSDSSQIVYTNQRNTCFH